MNETVTQIVESFAEHDIDLDPEEVSNKLETLTDDYLVPEDEARRSVEKKIAEKHGVALEKIRASASSSGVVAVNTIDTAEEWIDVEVTVADLWDPNSDAIAQVGLVGDESGTIKFVSWEASNLPSLEEGQAYRLENVVTDEYQGNYSIKLNKNSEITELDEEIEVGTNDTTLEAPIVDVQSGSGLIKRCPGEDCTRTLQNGRCAEHGAVDGEFDLRIKAIMDDGSHVQDVLFDAEMTAALTGIDLDDAIQMAQDALDTSVVADEIEDRIIGRYLEVTGPVMGQYLLVDDIAELGAPDHEQGLAAVEGI